MLQKLFRIFALKKGRSKFSGQKLLVLWVKQRFDVHLLPHGRDCNCPLLSATVGLGSLLLLFLMNGTWAIALRCTNTFFLHFFEKLFDRMDRDILHTYYMSQLPKLNALVKCLWFFSQHVF